MREPVFSLTKEKHKRIADTYRQNMPFYLRGFERCVMRVVLFVLWCVIWLESGTRYVNLSYVYFDSDTRAVIVSLLLSILGYFIFKPYKIFTERSFCGKVEMIEKQRAETVKKDKNGKKVREKGIRSGLYDGTNVLVIRKPDGRLARKTVPNLVAFENLYDIDTEVSVICGVRFPVPLDNKAVPENSRFCTRCGSFESAERTRCSMCFSLMWNK